MNKYPYLLKGCPVLVRIALSSMTGPVVNFGKFSGAVMSLNGVCVDSRFPPFPSKVFNSEGFVSGSSEEEDIFTGEDPELDDLKKKKLPFTLKFIC